MNSETRSSDEKMWAAIAHAIMVVNIIPVLPFVGVIGAMVIWLFKRKTSQYVGTQALQAFIFQAIAVFIYFIILNALAEIGLVLVLAAVVYSLFGAYRCYSGQDFKYAGIGKLVSPGSGGE